MTIGNTRTQSKRLPHLDVRVVVAGVGRDMVCVVVVLPPLHARAQEQGHNDAHDGVGCARGEQLVVAHIMAHQRQLRRMISPKLV